MAELMNPINGDYSTSISIIDDHFQMISIYLLCSSNNDDELKIQAVFGKNLKEDFQPIYRFDSNHKSETVVYRLEYNMLIPNNETTNINKFQLKMSSKTKNISGNFEDSRQRTIDINEPYQFLFDVQFQNQFPLITKRRTDELWNQLCFYTYFLIKNNLSDKIDCMIEQFQREIRLDPNRKLIEHGLNAFFHTCFTYLPHIISFLRDDQNAVKIFLQMFGLLPIEKDNLKKDNASLSSLAPEICGYIKIHLKNLLNTINTHDWLLVTQGLTVFMSAQMSGNQTTFNTFSLLEQMKDYPDKQELVANCLLKRLVELQISIQNETLTKLFSLVTDKHLLINCLDLVTTLDDYLLVLQYVIKQNKINEQMTLQLLNNFDRLCNRTDFTLSPNQILYLLTQYHTTTFALPEELHTFQSIIKSSSSLRQKIASYFDLNLISLETLCELFQLDHSISILGIDKTNYLIKIMGNYQNRTGNFYTTWFRCFLCEKYSDNTIDNQQNFRRLLKNWLDCFQNDLDIFSHIIVKLDSLFEHLQSVLIDERTDHRLDEFREYILNACFQPNSIFRILTDICKSVTNQGFLRLYETKFIDNFLDANRKNLKVMDDPSNPLFQLLKVCKIVDSLNHTLITNLIEACARLIQLNNEEIRDETFIHPSSTSFTYTVLFNKHLTNNGLFTRTIHELDTLWNRWTYTGLTLSDLQIWREHDVEQRMIFDKIWEIVRKHFGKSQLIETVFTTTEAEYSEKKKQNEAMMITLNLYCTKANDYLQAINSLRNMLQELHEKPIRAVETPKDLQVLKAIVKKLHPFVESKVWLNYYDRRCIEIERRDSQSSTSSRPMVLSKSFDADSDDDENRSFSVSMPIERKLEHPRLTRLSKENLTSVEILNHVQKIYEDFRLDIIRICADWRKEPICQWTQLFSDDQNIPVEVEILNKYLDVDIPKELIDILALWEKRNLTFIRHVCQGCINLAIRLKFNIKEDDYDILKSLVKLNDNILGDKCSFIYQTYLKQYVSRYSTNTITVWSQYSIASELIDFIVAMTSSDFDNLLENVSDYDDKLIGPKTVREYQILKHYFDQVYKSIEDLRQDKKQFLFPNILSCFDQVDISNQIENNIEELFVTCSTELPNMKQSHSELTEKEQSKRRLIIIIMQDSSLKFSQSDEFKIVLSPRDMNFLDLSELRDRARLIGYSYRNKMKTDDEHQIEQLESFIIFVDTIETILNTLTSLYIAGHPIVTEVVQRQQEFICHENQFNDLMNFNQTIQEILLVWEKTLCEKYILYPELTYFSCRQFDMLEQFIYHQSEHDEEEYGYHLLKYIGLNPRLTHRTNERTFTAEERLENLGKILSEQRQPRACLTRENQLKTEIFLIETEDGKILQAILSFSERFQSSANVNHLFYCSTETTWMEIRAFLYRCIYSREFHQLIRPEYLSTSIQDQIIDLIRQLIDENPQELFSFGIITARSSVNLQFIEGLKSLQIVQTIHEQDLMKETDFDRKVANLIKRCTIVTSRITGLGKTHIIREECSKLHKEYIKFPVNGDVQADLLAKRLLKAARQFQNGAIHFDIGVIDNYHQINDLINCLLLFRCFCFGQIAVSIPEETPIYIESDCSSHSYLFEHIIRFKYIRLINIKQIEWEKLIITQPVQFVVNYLKAIKDGTIKTKDITLEKMESIKVIESVSLIRRYFFDNHNIEYITWTKIFICISVFYQLFLGFSKCSFFIAQLLPNDRLKESRMDILQAFLKCANLFTSVSVETVRNQQRAANTHNRTDHYRRIQEFSSAIIRWDKMQPFTLIFSPTHYPIFVYKTEKDVPSSLKNYFDLYHQKLDTRSLLQRKFSAKKSDKPFFQDYKQLKHEELFEKLVELAENEYASKAICRKCFRRYEYDTLLCEDCTDVPDLLERAYSSSDDREKAAFKKRMADIIELEYVITADNFIKMLLVFLRVQSRVPVLIMGETGCGKTALINCLCRKILDDKLHVFRLHAGVTNEKLLKEMNELIIQAEQLPRDRRLWVFFDEFNTIFNISLLKEIICERTLLGKNLPENMRFLGTCNPRRQKSDKAIFNENVGLKKDRYGTLKQMHNRPNLLYTVTQIPETMLEYIWDYGYLDQDTEKTYIEAALKTCEGFANNPKLFKIVVDLISESHKFLRDLEDVSSVSLRDVARFCRLYKWFGQYLNDSLMSPKKLAKDASLLALLLCYYFRLDTKEKKERYLERLDKYLCAVYDQPPLTHIKFFNQLLEQEQERLIKQLEIPDDMANNRALKNNLFVLFSCIINRIPVFLCGKPGASKTSAVQILMNNLKGLRSNHNAFRKLPELVAVNFQGSQSCTSKNIEQVFKRASKFRENEKTSSPLLPVIIFDEIGLAELSPHNPLKVLHGHLEIEECQFGFVGISNWRLDASKMNRALYIACLDPDDEDLKSTGVFLSKMNSKSNLTNPFDANIILGLAQAYWDLQGRMATEHRNEDYFGLRDYYSLIKGIVRDWQKYPQRSQYEIIYQQLIINFGGINNGYEYMWEKFCTLLDRHDLMHIFETPSPKQLIEKCLTNRNSRHLMLIVDRESTIDHVERYITTNPILKGSVKTLVGSQFEGDLVSNRIYSESYSTRVLMEIILHAETPITLIMRRMNHLYDNLYDLFNQNFAISGRKKYCRIALSAISSPRCFVHDEFYCVILLNAEDVDTSDPPFLNRFQKHYIPIDKLTQPRAWTLTCQLLEWTLNLPIPNVNKQFLTLKNLILPYSADYICDLVVEICQEDDLTDEMILHSCKEKLMRACSFDFPLVLSLTGNEDLIEHYYNIHSNILNISQLISSTFEQTFPTKRLIYTYTQIYDTIDYENPDQIPEIKLSSIKTELDLINILKKSRNPSSILIIRLDYHREHHLILSLKYNILNQWNELKDCHLWIIFHYRRNKVYQTTNDVLFNGWDILMIEDLNNPNKFISKDILLNPSYQYFLHNYQYKFLDNLFDEFLHRTLAKFRYENLSNEQQTQRYNLLVDILNHESNSYLRGIFLETIDYLIKTISNPEENRFQDWRYDLISNQYTSLTSRSFDEALQSIMSSFYDSYFQLLIHHFECFNLIDSYFYLRENPSIDLQTFWNDAYRLSLKTIDNSMMNVNLVEIPFINDLKLPHAMKENQSLKQIREILQTLQEETEEEDSDLLIIKLLKENTVYEKSLIDCLLSQQGFLELYYHDQLILFHMENQFQFSTKFILKLLTTNIQQRTINRVIQLIDNADQLAEICRLFEDGFKLYDENLFVRNMDQQIQSIDQLPSSFYSIIFQNDKFYFIPPNSHEIDEQFEFHPLSDPFIEISLLNLIECLISPTFISQSGDIEQITATFSSINQRVLRLTHYDVRNRERLSSYMSLLRCIRTLNPSQALGVFQKSCTDFKFNAVFQTCEEIDQFIRNLEIYINQQQGCEFDRVDVRTILLKLEVEFLKNWLVDHSDQYGEILQLINQTENHLWKYSAKIFSHIIGDLDLLQDIEWSYAPTSEQIQKINQLDEHLHFVMGQFDYKIHRLFVNRIHLNLTLNHPMDNQEIRNYLTNFYEHFERSIQYITTSYLTPPARDSSNIQLILLLSFLKFYTQLYSYALVNNIRFQQSSNIDHYLTNNRLTFCLTLKMFILKQILNLSKMDLSTFQTNVECRDTTWLDEFFKKFREEKKTNGRSLILPVPILEAEDEYLQVNRILDDYTDDHAIEKLIASCSTNQYLCYCFYLWFIKSYTQYANGNYQSNDHYRTFFQRKLSDESKIFLQPIGIQFLHMLCTNFSVGSYFHLDSFMSDRDIAIRLVILNIFALTLSFKSFPRPNWINTILFDTHSQMPTNYSEHLQALCLFGLIDINPIKSNMKYVRAAIKQRLSAGHLPTAGRYIYQCSKDCLYLYHFTHCGVPNQKGQCLFCKKEIGSSKYGNLIERNPPQIRMTIEEGLRVIEEYIEKSNREKKFGYYEVLSSKQSTLDQRPDHLKSSITFRFLHLFLHSILILLKEFKYLPIEDLETWNIYSDTYFPNHLEKDYELLEKCIPDSQYCYVWIFQLLNSMLNGFEEPSGSLNSREKVIQIEKIIEEQLIAPHCLSKMDDINTYKKTFMKFTEKEDISNTLMNFLDERTENDRRYPFLPFFNVTQIVNENRVEQFFNNLKTMAHAKTNYPLTMYILEHIDVWNNIQHLHSMIQFINYVRDKYNYRISRQQAVTKSIQECLDEKGNELFKNFCTAWSKITLGEVRYGCQLRTFDRHITRDKKLAFFSLNISKDDSSLTLAAALQTIGKLQNNLVNFFHNEIIQSTSICRLPMHMIEKKHLLQLDAEFIHNKILKHALVINFEYGQSKDIIYDYEEMEMTFRSLVSCLPLINNDKFRKIQYQFELYSENNALINAVRHHVEQKQLDHDLRKQYQHMLQKKDDNDILQYLGSLDYIFTYLQNRNYRSMISTIKLFVKEYIHSSSFLHQNLFLQSSFASTRLEYIIDLYELIEEIAFDKIFRHHIEEKLNDQTIDINQRRTIQEKFLSRTIDNQQIAVSLRNACQWISTLKRFMVRILPDYVDLNIPVEIYLKRTDLWNSQISETDIETIQLDDSILLKHTFIILLGLENRLNDHEPPPPPPPPPTTTPELVNKRDANSLFRPSLSQRNIARPRKFRDT